MQKKSITQGDMKIASEEDLLTIDASTGEKTYRYITPEDYRLFETETILMREEAQRTIDEINCHIGNRRIAFKCVFHVAQILSASLDEYRQLVKDLRSRAYVTLYNIYDAQVEQMWHQLSPTLTEFVTLEEKIQKNLMDLAESCPVSALEDIVGRRSPHKEASATPADYEDLKRRAVERVTESIRHVRRTAKEIEVAGAALCHTRELRSEAEEAIIYHYIKRQYEESHQDAHLARVAIRHLHYLDNRKAEADMRMLQCLLDRTEERYERCPICKLWADWDFSQEEETEAFAHELSQHAFGKKDFERLFMYQAEHRMLTEEISKRNDEDHQSDPLFSHWVDPYKVEEILRFWVKAHIKTKKQWYLVWCIMKYSFDIIREGQDKSDFAVRMNLMFKDAEVKCEVNSFRREEKKMNHNKHFSYWHKETDPDYSIAESLYRKLNEKDLYRK